MYTAVQNLTLNHSCRLSNISFLIQFEVMFGGSEAEKILQPPVQTTHVLKELSCYRCVVSFSKSFMRFVSSMDWSPVSLISCHKHIKCAPLFSACVRPYVQN